jgi:predicted phosphohydrolase
MSFQWIPSRPTDQHKNDYIFLKFSNCSCFKCMHDQFRAIFDYWKIVAKQCQNILTVKLFILPSHYEVKYPMITYQIFRVWYMPTFDQFDSFSNFYSAHDESLKPFFPSSDIQKIIQQCFQSIKLFRNAEKIFYFSFFGSFLHELSNAIYIYIIN